LVEQTTNVQIPREFIIFIFCALPATRGFASQNIPTFGLAAMAAALAQLIIIVCACRREFAYELPCNQG
jgi:hypothetical protein